jgi:hypothetical protein
MRFVNLRDPLKTKHRRLLISSHTFIDLINVARIAFVKMFRRVKN